MVFLPEAEAQRKRNGKRAKKPALMGPERMVLGEDKSALLRLKNARAPVEFYANVGTIGPVKTNPKGEVEVSYQPPTGRFPQVAIVVAASADHAVLEWVAIPLHGQPSIRIESIRRADVVAHVGDKNFGPVRTNAKGRASLQVVVPPGMQTVPLTTTNRLGAVSKSETALNAPPFSRMLAICPQGDADDVLFVATDEHSSPLAAVDLKIDSSVALGKVRKLREGVFAARIPMAGATESQAFKLSASLGENPKFKTSCSGERPGNLPLAMHLRLSSQSYRAGSGGAIELVVQLDYESTERRRKPRLVLEPSLGSLSSLSRRSETEYVATWSIPDSFSGQKAATVSVDSEGQTKLKAESKIELQAGAPASLKLKAAPGPIVADGSSTTKITATLKDAHGNGVADSKLEAPGPNLGPFVPASEPGKYVATYTALKSYDAQSDTFAVRETSTGTQARLSVALVPIKRRFVVDLRLGYTTNLGIVQAPSGTLAAAYRVPVGEHYAFLGSHVGFYNSNSSLDADDGGELDLKVLGTPLFATAGYEHVLRLVSLFAGVGGGLVYSRTKLSSMSTGSRSVAKFSRGGGGFIGGRLPLGPGHLATQASYWTAPINHQGVSGDLLGVSFELGYGFDL
jgi:hypothetical protein